MIPDIKKGTSWSKLISFADDTIVYSNITEADDCDDLQYDINTNYNWVEQTTYFLTLKSSITFHNS